MSESKRLLIEKIQEDFNGDLFKLLECLEFPTLLTIYKHQQLKDEYD
jgi:hypothetical protein